MRWDHGANEVSNGVGTWVACHSFSLFIDPRVGVSPASAPGIVTWDPRVRVLTTSELMFASG